MNKSSKLRCYCSGRMGSNPNDKKWREDITPFLEKLGFIVLDPYILEPKKLRGLQPKNLPEGYKHWQELHKSKEPHLRERFRKYFKRIISYDIGMVKNRADVIIVLWDEGCKTGAGTASELTMALLSNKPVYAVATIEMPIWANACCEEIFPSFDELKKFLLEEYGDDLQEEVTKDVKKDS